MDRLVAALLFLVTLVIFWFSPVRQVTDSQYSMFLSECLIHKQTFALDNCNVHLLKPMPLAGYITNGGIYQLEIYRGRIYYFPPPGSSVLAIPYVAVANAFGISAANADGTPNYRGERAIETSLAAILMALAAVLFYFTSRLLLPLNWSVVISLGSSLGTQIWSTASRGLWSHTWSVFLAGIVVYLLLSHELGRRRLHPALLATLLSWMYFVRPTNSVAIIAITIFLLLYHRRSLLPFLLTGALWFAGFIYYSWHNFGEVLPNYYHPNRLTTDVFLLALRGNVISPARGLLVYVPVLFFVFFLLVRYWPYRPVPRLFWLGLCIFVGYMVVMSGFAHWWGGASFGPRFATDAVPWLVLLSIIGVKAMLQWREEHVVSQFKLGLQQAVGLVLLGLSVFINGRGAIARDTWRWNEHKDIVQVQKKLWDWRQPQFMAGLIHPPLDREYPVITPDAHIDFSKPESDKFIWYGWSGSEDVFRWTEGNEAALVFALDEIQDLTLRIKADPFLYRGLSDEQRVFVELNGKGVDSFLLTEGGLVLTMKLPKEILRQKNVLTFKLPDANSPDVLKISIDERLLGLAVYWIELVRTGAAESSSQH